MLLYPLFPVWRAKAREAGAAQDGEGAFLPLFPCTAYAVMKRRNDMMDCVRLLGLVFVLYSFCFSRRAFILATPKTLGFSFSVSSFFPGLTGWGSVVVGFPPSCDSPFLFRFGHVVLRGSPWPVVFSFSKHTLGGWWLCGRHCWYTVRFLFWRPRLVRAGTCEEGNGQRATGMPRERVRGG